MGVAYAYVCIPQKASANFYCGSASSQPCVHNDALAIVESVQLVLSAVDSQLQLILSNLQLIPHRPHTMASVSVSFYLACTLPCAPASVP